MRFFLVLVFIVAFTTKTYAKNYKKQDIVDYLNGLDNVKISFKQKYFGELSHPYDSSGIMYLLRPYNLRIDYKSPNKITIVFKNSEIMYHDHGLGEVSYFKNDHYFMDMFFVANNMADKIVAIYENDKALRVLFKLRKNDVDVNIELYFSIPLNLTRMKVVHGYEEYDIYSMDIKYSKLDKKLFSLRNPKF